MPAVQPEPVVYDAGALIAADRNDRELWADHRGRLEAGVVPSVPAPVVAQTSRAPSQAQLRRLLRGCDVVPMTEPDAHEVGGLLAKSGTPDVVDGFVALVATQRHAATVTSDPAELSHLLRCAGGTARIIDI
jgi:predicted nucleic acid-binding protein